MTADDPRFRQAFPISAKLGMTPKEVARELRMPLAHFAGFVAGRRYAL